MKKLFVKIALLVVLVLIIASVVRVFMPQFWHTPVTQAKLEYLHENPNFNVVFMGTSRMAKGINPHKFDNTLKQETGKNLKSFNFAIGGTTLGENITIFNALLKNETFHADFIVMELNSVHNAVRHNVSVSNLHTPRINYWVNFKMLVFSIKNALSFKSNKYNFNDRLTFCYNYTTAFIENKLNASMFQGFIAYFSNNEHYRQYKKLKANQGFVPYIGKKKKGKEAKVKNWIKTNLSPELNKRKKAAKAFFTKQKSNNKSIANQAYYKQMLSMIKQCEQRGIHLVFIVPSLLKPAILNEIAPLYYSLPPKNRIELAQPDKYPELYEIANCYDPVHLNKKGSTYMADFLAKKMVQKFGKNKFKIKKQDSE